MSTWFIAVPYLLLLTMLAIYGVHRLFMLSWLRNTTTPVAPEIGTHPTITVQLPVYNEPLVIERLLHHVSHLDWPRDALQIQVLDDSSDATSVLAAERIASLQEQGLDIVHIHRDSRAGFKAGALAHGLQQATGEFIAIFDADFVPQPDFLQQLMPSFTGPEIGMVQARWGHLDRDASWLNRIQALLLDGHFVIEHTARYRSGRFFNFNGTAGIWRRKTIEDAGGWSHDTITEDLDLSYRAQLRGWQFVYRPDVVVSAELPHSMNAFLTQQHRWAKGTTQTARKLVRRIATAPLPWRVRLEAIIHLTMVAGYPMVLLLALLMAPSVVARSTLMDLQWLDTFAVLATTGSVSLFYGAALILGGVGLRRRWLELLGGLAVGIGITASQTVAVIEGFFGQDRHFVRTPKRGQSTQSTLHAPVRPLRVVLTTVCALYFILAIPLLMAQGHWLSLPFLLLFGSGFCLVSAALIRETFPERVEASAEMDPVPSTK